MGNSGLHEIHQMELIKVNVSDEVHKGVNCDGCGMSPLVGFRHKCLICPDYDLCHNCRMNSLHPHKEMTTISSTGISSEESHHGFKCDGCGMDPLIGLRFRCLVCPDYDLCNSCKFNSIHHQHAFKRIVGNSLM